MFVISPPFSPCPFANQSSTIIKDFLKFWTQERFHFPKEVKDGGYMKYLYYALFYSKDKSWSSGKN